MQGNSHAFIYYIYTVCVHKNKNGKPMLKTEKKLENIFNQLFPKRKLYFLQCLLVIRVFTHNFPHFPNVFLLLNTLQCGFDCSILFILRFFIIISVCVKFAINLWFHIYVITILENMK